MGGLWLAWLFWFCEALALCVGAKPNVPNALAKNFLCALGIFLFFSVSGCCLVRYRSVGSGGRPAIATNIRINATFTSNYLELAFISALPATFFLSKKYRGIHFQCFAILLVFLLLRLSLLACCLSIPVFPVYPYIF